ncbi:ATP-dependent helicase [Caldinitratiruptor microaerophilus]|uniref:DNA 3'-5' helicase n=1 Tax=Caldinitratiruptor microaerophilus TaxID=671077 RepID=A0AA35G7A8_9FIRM|nr:ATP-dependent helicase [Caldinitratiruptor microaerophilus]BDG59118.1 DNA helicase [Caldinitratiruptor microaerophilus]
MTPRPDQAAVLGYEGGYLAVSAVPGAGKTHVLARLAANLIASGRPAPGQVLVVTYTNAAVGNFRARIGRFLTELRLPPGEGYDVRTLHSLALAIVRERPERLGVPDPPPVLGDMQRDRLVARITRQWLRHHAARCEGVFREDLRPQVRARAEEDWEKALRRVFAAMFSRFKAQGLEPAEADRLTRSLPAGSLVRWAAEAYHLYERELAGQNLLDYDDLVRGARALLAEDPDLARRLRRRWTFILEDEAQDSTPAQEAILEALAGPGGNLVRVGDPNQAIMGTFTAADPNGFRRFCARSDVRHRTLVHAGRSSVQVIAAANRLVAWATEEAPDPAARSALVRQEIRPVPPGDPQPNPAAAPRGLQIVESRTLDDELRRLARWAARGVREAPGETLAVLLPTNELVQAFARRVREEGVRAVELRRAEPEDGDVLDRLTPVVEFLARPDDPALLGPALAALAGPAAVAPAAPPDLRPEELFFPLESPRPLHDLRAFYGDAAEVLRPAAERLRALLADPPGRPDAWLLAAARALGLEGADAAAAHLLAARAAVWLEERPLAGPGDVARWLRESGEELRRLVAPLRDRRGFAAEPGVVYAVTAHSAKGLEWDAVAVACVTEHHYPATVDAASRERWYLREGFADPEAAALAGWQALTGDAPAGGSRTGREEFVAERLRLLYVAITRARRRLVLSYHTTRRQGGRDVPVRPSPALEALRSLVEAMPGAGATR